MIDQIINYVRAWIRGDEAELNVDFSVRISWLDLAVTSGLILLGVALWK